MRFPVPVGDIAIDLPAGTVQESRQKVEPQI